MPCSDGSDEEFWEHEWATHGTCYSTLEPDCLPSGSKKGAEAVAFFETVVGLFKNLPTYKWLEDAGITPGDQEYDAEDVIAALEKGYGKTPQVGCTNGALGSLSYYYTLKGSAIDGKFIPIGKVLHLFAEQSVAHFPSNRRAAEELMLWQGQVPFKEWQRREEAAPQECFPLDTGSFDRFLSMDYPHTPALYNIIRIAPLNTLHPPLFRG